MLWYSLFGSILLYKLAGRSGLTGLMCRSQGLPLWPSPWDKATTCLKSKPGILSQGTYGPLEAILGWSIGLTGPVGSSLEDPERREGVKPSSEWYLFFIRWWSTKSIFLNARKVQYKTGLWWLMDRTVHFSDLYIVFLVYFVLLVDL